MTGLHQLMANAMVLYFLVLGVWGVVLALRHAPLGGSYRGALLIALGLGAVQAVVGLILLLTGRRPGNELHFLYGISILVALPLARQLRAGRGWSPVLTYGLTCLFMAGLAIRGITTGL